MSRLALIAGGFFWALVCFYGGLWLTFPGEEASERLAWEVQENSRGAWKLLSVDAKPWRVTGVTLEDVQLLSVPKARRGQEPVPSLVMRAESLSTRAELLPLLSGGYVAGIKADLYKGDLSGRVGQTGDELIIDLVGDDLDLSTYPFGTEDWTLDAEGLLQAEIDLTIDQEDIKASKGTIVLSIDDFALAGVNFSGITFDQRAEFTKARLRLKVDNGKAEVKEGDFISDLVQIEVGGDISLADPISRSRMNLTVSFKLADDLDQMASLMLKSARDDSGRYHFKASGSLGSPSFREDRVAARGRSAGSNSTKRASPRAVGEPSLKNKEADGGGFRDRRELPPEVDRRRMDDDRRLPERRRPDIADRMPMDRDGPEPDDIRNIGPDGPADEDEVFYDEDEEGEFIDEGGPNEDELDDMQFDR